MNELMQNPKKLSFTELAVLAMKRVNRSITPSDLWQFVLQNNLHYQLQSFDLHTKTFTGKTPQDTFQHGVRYSGLFDEVPNTKPKQYILKNHVTNVNLLDDGFELQNPIDDKKIVAKNSPKKSNFHERDLHPLLAYFLKHNDYFGAYSRTILHEKSQKGTKGEDRWLHPDMVAVNFEYTNYIENNVLKFIEVFDIKPIKIFSFEVKKELNFSNYKESFFQAVSNSSWANEGYLVALNVNNGSQFIEALQKLSQSFGIGIIELNVDNISQSKILSPAKYKEKMDYSVIDELASKNEDFRLFLKTVTEFDIENPYRYSQDFDTILSNDELGEYLKKIT